ncbi:MAG TPA: hypothetical protein VGI54_11005 [Solirubrobacteraceae bacterium]
MNPAAGPITFSRLRAVSFIHSAIYLALLACWLLPGLEGPTYVLGWCHGLLWIGMSLACLYATRKGVIPFWLAVVVVVIGGLGPFAGTIGFVVYARRLSLAA